MSTPSTIAYTDTVVSEGPVTTASTDTYNGSSASSIMAETDIPDPAVHAINLASYIFNVGYMGQNWGDIQLSFFNATLKLHRIILARSPFLTQYLVNAQPFQTIHLQFQDENINSEAVYTCIHHLYQPAFHLLKPESARSILATALLFGGMPELVQRAYMSCRETIRAENLPEWIQWIAKTRARPDNVYAYINGDTQDQKDIELAWEEGSSGRYGEWSARLKQDVFEYITQTLPSSSSLSSSTPSDHNTISATPSSNNSLIHHFVPLPYPLLKAALESPHLQFNSNQERFAFAKKVIAARKKSQVSYGQDESAVLAFKGGDGMEVQVTRKPKRGKLWKVEG